VGVVANAALGGSAVDVVLHAVTRENACVAVVELDRKVTGELALNLAQDLAKPRLQLDQPGRLVELRLGGAPFVRLDTGFQLDGAHISTDDRGYSAVGSQITLTQAGRPDLTARSSAGRIWSRSEERRVGKECRSRWWRWRYKKRNRRRMVSTVMDGEEVFG